MTSYIQEGPVPGTCALCGTDGQLRIEFRMEAKPLGTHSLAGAQMKVAANRSPWMVCDACGSTCRGKPA